MKIRAMDIYALIGALKSQYMYQNSKLQKAKQKGEEYKPVFTSISPDDTLFLLVEELENAIKKVKDIPSANWITLNIIAKDEKNYSANSNKNNENLEMPEVPF